MKLAPVQSIADLRSRAQRDLAYKMLALRAAENLGGNPRGNLDSAIQWLRLNAEETDEEGVVDEINFCR